MPVAIAAALLVALLIALVTVMVLQEGRSRRTVTEPAYVITDAIEFAIHSVGDDVLQRVGSGGVRRIIEWSAHYLQGLADRAARRKGVTVVAGGEGNAIEYISSQLERRGFVYVAEDIEAVLVTEAHYLQSIGALGSRVDEEELA